MGLFSRRKPWTTVREALNLDEYVMTAGTTGEGRPTSPTSPTSTLGTKGNAYAIECRRGRADGSKWEETPDTQPSPALRVASGGKGCGQWSANAATRAKWEESSGRRRLTVTECRILMGWHERYDAILATQTKTAAYRVLGNGCVPAWVEAHARAVMEA